MTASARPSYRTPRIALHQVSTMNLPLDRRADDWLVV
jgi:hypothetical protein